MGGQHPSKSVFKLATGILPAAAQNVPLGGATRAVAGKTPAAENYDLYGAGNWRGARTFPRVDLETFRSPLSMYLGSARHDFEDLDIHERPGGGA